MAEVPAEPKVPKVNVGDPAPEVKLQGIGGKEWSLADQKGKKVVLLFYVLDWTPG